MRVFGKINIIGLDNGYGNIKTANGIFPASVTRCEAEPAHAQDVLVYDGKYYVIGAGHREFTLDKVGISRQGVHELLTRAARKMFEMEEKLHVAARFQRVENGLEKCRTMMREGRYDDAERMIDALIRFDQEENNGL